MTSAERRASNASGRAGAKEMPQNREGTGFRGPSPDVGRATQFKSGKSGNPGGRPKRDYSAEIAAAVFEENPEEIYRAMRKAVLKGDSRVFTALADRAFGKVKTHVSDQNTPVQVIIDNVNVADLNEP